MDFDIAIELLYKQWLHYTIKDDWNVNMKYAIRMYTVKCVLLVIGQNYQGHEERKEEVRHTGW